MGLSKPWGTVGLRIRAMYHFAGVGKMVDHFIDGNKMVIGGSINLND